jgi:hypothetical protein
MECLVRVGSRHDCSTLCLAKAIRRLSLSWGSSVDSGRLPISSSRLCRRHWVYHRVLVTRSVNFFNALMFRWLAFLLPPYCLIHKLEHVRRYFMDLR